MLINYLLFVLSFVCIPECYGFIAIILTLLLSMTQLILSIIDLVIVQKNIIKQTLGKIVEILKDG